MSSAVGSLEAEALKRKARLAAIRQAAEGDGNGTASADAEPTVVKLRNYEPTSDIPAVKTETPGLQKLELAEKEKEILKNDPDAAIDTVDIATLAPRKVTWDLERDLAKKMGKLERRTDRAIAELVARRLKEAGDGEVAMDQLIAAEEQADQLENQDSDADE